VADDDISQHYEQSAAAAAEFARIGELFDAQLLNRGAEAPGAIAVAEPHRNHHVYATGASLYALGLRQRDADAVMGLLDLPHSRLAQIFADLAKVRRLDKFGAILPFVIDHYRDDLTARGRHLSWKRRWEAYQAELASWQAVDEQQRLHGAWRIRAMSAGQGELVRVTATLLEILMPEEMTRGEAADWLSANGANLYYRKEF